MLLDFLKKAVWGGFIFSVSSLAVMFILLLLWGGYALLRETIFVKFWFLYHVKRFKTQNFIHLAYSSKNDGLFKDSFACYLIPYDFGIALREDWPILPRSHFFPYELISTVRIEFSLPQKDSPVSKPPEKLNEYLYAIYLDISFKDGTNVHFYLSSPLSEASNAYAFQHGSNFFKALMEYCPADKLVFEEKILNS